MAFDVLSFVMGQQAGKASGGSSGGGSLPAGIYWEAIKKPFYAQCRFFEFKGETYIVIYNSTASAYEIYKYSNGGFSFVTTCATGAGVVSYGVIIEYDGEVHFLGDGGSYGETHTVWDGTTFTSKKRLPDFNESSNNTGAVVFEGELYACLGYTNLYKWNKSDDTWTKVATTLGGLNLMVINGSMYHMNNDKLYLFKNGAFELVQTFSNLDSTFTTYTNSFGFAKDDQIFIREYVGKVYRYNLESQELSFLGYAPKMSAEKTFLVNNQFYQSDSTNTAMCMHEVTG